MNNILEIKNLNKKFKDFSLNNVSFSVPKGCVMGLIGPYGSGKTTTLKSILNIVYPDSGEITLLGMKASSDSVEYKNDIGVIIDLPFFLLNWKVKEVEAAVAPFYSHWNHNVFNDYIEKFNLSKKKKMRELSPDMKVKFMLAVAFSHNARLLILDEPTLGLDPVARDEIINILSEFIIDKNNGILFSTHNKSDLDKIADYITFIFNGKIKFTGDKDQFIKSFMLVKGGIFDLTKEQKNHIIGFRVNKSGFEGMIKTDDIDKLPHIVCYEEISLDDIINCINEEERTDE